MLFEINIFFSVQLMTQKCIRIVNLLVSNVKAHARNKTVKVPKHYWGAAPLKCRTNICDLDWKKRRSVLTHSKVRITHTQVQETIITYRFKHKEIRTSELKPNDLGRKSNKNFRI